MDDITSLTNSFLYASCVVRSTNSVIDAHCTPPSARLYKERVSEEAVLCAVHPPMSSDEEIHEGDFRVLTGLTDLGISKRKKVPRACDICRRKKIRCDAHSKPSTEKCSHCAAYKLDCTFAAGATRRSLPKPQASTWTPSGPRPPSDMLYRYIEDLEERIDLLEKLLRRVAPTVNIDTEVGPSFNMQTWQAVKGKSLSLHTLVTQVATTSSTLHVLPRATVFTTAPKDHSRFSSPAQPSIRSDSSHAQEDLEPSDGEIHQTSNDGTVGDYVENALEKLSLGDTEGGKFMGKSSGVSLVRTALALKETVSGNAKKIHDACKYVEGASRPKFWKASPWEWMAAPSPAIESLRFPPPDLARTLIDRCFDEVIPLMPVVHRPSFEKQYAEEKHRTDLDFARLLLVVCSVGARTCKDARVCLTSPEGEVEWNSAGWIYFTQVHQMTKPILDSTKLVDLQIMALSATYLEGAAASSGAWIINGIGLRFAEDIGAHREAVYTSTHAFDNQIWKRTFWCLVQKDREISISLGRPICVNDEDIDVQLPLEVDDNGWDETKQAWVQPVGKPSQLAFLVQQSKLTSILANCMKTVYCINKSKVRLGFVGTGWEQDKVSELDSALNEWQEALPDHLRWDPHMGPTFYQQAATLRITFYYIQINIHRPFIQLSSSSRRALSLPSLAVCTNAARSTAHILETTMEMPSSPVFVSASFLSGVVLMISIWEGRRSGLNVDMSRQIAGVQACTRYLKRWEDRYYLSGRLYDVLRQTASIGDVPLPGSPHSNTPGKTTKRRREDDSPGHDIPPELSQSTTGGPSPSLTTPYTTGFSNKAQPQFTARSVDTSQHTQASTDLANLNKAVSPTGGLDVFTLHPLPLNPWPPQSLGDGSEPPPVLTSTWKSFPISGSSVSGFGVGFQGLPGYGRQEVDWQELLGPLVPDEMDNTSSLQPEHWNGGPVNQWDWLNEVPDVLPTSSHPLQQAGRPSTPNGSRRYYENTEDPKLN
ncbi:hypothetical protein FRB93_010711 [Tulasnella sp. JGI-2019a]|nr:hypothetical protein FRB93_010711 [Tulasnella sp. JGI-2019a]